MAALDPSTIAAALAGGALIGLAAALILYGLGRVAGVSGILGQALERAPDGGWRLAFLAGLGVAGVAATFWAPEFVTSQLARPTSLLIISGVLVGVGTRMGRGCTSGHGICGIARWSTRSLVATGSFMIAGAVSATFVVRALGIS